MHVLRGKAAILNAKTLFSLIEKRREIEAKEKELKEFFKGHLDGQDGVLKAGDFLVTIETKERKDLDRAALKDHLGDRFGEFQKIGTYQTVAIAAA